MPPPECPSSNIVETTWDRLNLANKARKAAISFFQVALVFIALVVDMSYSVFSDFLEVTHPVLWFVELSLCLLLVLHVTSHGFVVCKYFWIHFFGRAVSLTEEQRVLMAIPVQDRSFQTPPKSRVHSQPSTPLAFSNSPSLGGGDVSPHRLTSGYAAPSPSSLITPSPASYSLMRSDSANKTSPYHSFVSASSLHNSFNASFSSLDRSLNMSAVSQSSRNSMNGSALRSRRSASLPVSPRGVSRKRIESIDSLKKYIEEEEIRSENNRQASLASQSPSTSFWSYGSNPLDVSHILKRFAYQLAPRSAVSPTPNSSSDAGACHGLEEVWGKFGATEDHLYLWTERLRKWLSFTIITRLKAEMEEVNECLQRVGCEDTQIGEVGISTLKQLALTRGNIVPGLNSVIPYLDVMANQEYLLRRIRDLSTGSMSEFSWNKGGNYGKPWGEHLATDAAVVMHLFCSYLDARLPAHPKYPDGKPFTSVHFIKTPEKPNTEKKDNLLLYQSSINPPHFQVVFASEIFNLPKGRNNMFQAILLFLYFIKEKEAGMLGRVNLGKSGLNILWIFD